MMSSSEDVWFPISNFSSSEWISMKFVKKVQHYKRKVMIDFGGYGTMTNSL